MKASFLSFVIFAVFLRAFGSEKPCQEKTTYIEVKTSSSNLFLCKSGTTFKFFTVSLGKGGIDKKIEGDGRTPIGKYSLGVPRPSNRFFVFIPVGYPTEEQRKVGLTGGDVGIHGPFRPLTWLGRVNTWINWTNGCIAVASESEISEIAEWVRINQISTIVID